MKTLLLILAMATSASALACGSDYNCSYGERCIGSNGYSGGMCVKQVQQTDYYSTYNQPKAIVQSTCQYNTQCGYGESCVKQSGAMWGVCQ